MVTSYPLGFFFFFLSGQPISSFFLLEADISSIVHNKIGLSMSCYKWPSKAIVGTQETICYDQKKKKPYVEQVMFLTPKPKKKKKGWGGRNQKYHNFIQFLNSNKHGQFCGASLKLWYVVHHLKNVVASWKLTHPYRTLVFNISVRLGLD